MASSMLILFYNQNNAAKNSKDTSSFMGLVENEWKQIQNTSLTIPQMSLCRVFVPADKVDVLSLSAWWKRGITLTTSEKVSVF